MKEEKLIRELATQAIADDQSLFIVDIIIKGNKGNQKVLILLDGDEGVSIDVCAKISRTIGAELEEMDAMEGKYTLEVSSPGLDFPLSLNRQYKKNCGRQLEIDLIEDRKIEGELASVHDDHLVLNTAGEHKTIRFEEIKQSKVKVSFK